MRPAATLRMYLREKKINLFASRNRYANRSAQCDTIGAVMVAKRTRGCGISRSAAWTPIVWDFVASVTIGSQSVLFQDSDGVCFSVFFFVNLILCIESHPVRLVQSFMRPFVSSCYKSFSVFSSRESKISKINVISLDMLLLHTEL